MSGPSKVLLDHMIDVHLPEPPGTTTQAQLVVMHRERHAQLHETGSLIEEHIRTGEPYRFLAQRKEG